jgi:hypothetical protein
MNYLLEDVLPFSLVTQQLFNKCLKYKGGLHSYSQVFFYKYKGNALIWKDESDFASKPFEVSHLPLRRKPTRVGIKESIKNIRLK